MGPIVSPWTALPVGRRWLVLLVIPAGTALGLALECPRDAPARKGPVVEVARVSLPPPIADEHLRLDWIAASHRLWVADHGRGCAREIDRLLPYTGLAITDPWGGTLVLTCHRAEVQDHDEIAVEVRSAGPDHVRGTTDDILGSDITRFPIAH